ncbi:DNA repair protein RadC [Persephonella sp. KM09-Lau-8]|uniref:RadC family protein n=1 Tax=Persephonella sp. KM09-Lau-8 TaxID=1158345 RepID=UPI000494FD1D|nr:DNA repair protein RadC [Persephonella sp. KM09-Lau-8]
MKFEKYIYKKRIKDLPEELMPREKALKYGLSSLSDAELLALSLGKGTKELNVLGLADLLLKKFKGLSSMKNITLEQLTEIKGIGKVKALQILSIFEILKRIEQQEENTIFSTPEDVYSHVKWLSKEKKEQMLVLYTNTMNQLLGEETVAIGSINVVSVRPRDIFQPAFKYNAYGIILVHNHPEGSPYPSKEDIKFTELVSRLSFEIGFELLDHIIVGKKDFYSFAREGKLDNI